MLLQMADLSKIRDLCDVLGFNLLQKIRAEVDRSVKDINSWLASDLKDETADRLNEYVETLSRIKFDTFSDLKRRALAILSYWDVLHVPFDAKKEFTSLLYYVSVDSEAEITQANALSLEFIKKVEKEYDRLREQLNVVVLKKKSKLEQILKTAHLASSFNDKGIYDPVAALEDINIQISQAKASASKRASIVTKVEFIQHANGEVQWYKASKKDAVPLDNTRSMEAELLQRALPKMMSELKAELANWNAAFPFDGLDAREILMTIEADHRDEAGY
ncbi:unnamed protein product [Urochloa decumbens]|uniref:Uncharacterized protein n=2 Tax=Urochloa decumbens TaxID=240449 RepID=A0ABC8W2G5_9POAL